MTMRRNNILFILSDQQQRDALGCMGNTGIDTPVIDRLAAQGPYFDGAIPIAESVDLIVP